MIRILFAAFLTFCCINQVLAKTLWEEYLDLPSANNAKRVTEISYSTVNGDGHKHRDVRILALQIDSGDSSALDLAFRLCDKVDVALLEDLTAILGHSVRAYPTLFLEELVHRAVPDVVIESIILNDGLEYSDRPAAQLYEIEMRYESILAVQPTNAEIESVKKRCIKILKSHIDEEKLHLPERLKSENHK